MYGVASTTSVPDLTSNAERKDIQAADLDLSSLDLGESTRPLSNTNGEINNLGQQRDQSPMLSPEARTSPISNDSIPLS